MKGDDAMDIAKWMRARLALNLKRTVLRKMHQQVASIQEVMACTNE